MIRTLLAVGLLALAFPTTARAGDDEVEKAVAKLSTQFTDALGKGDTGYLASAMSDDWSIIVETGAIMDKAVYLKNITSGDLKFEKLEKADMKIRVFGDSALVITRNTSKMTYKGREIGGTSVVTEAFAKRNGKWLCVAVQLTRLAPTASEKP